MSAKGYGGLPRPYTNNSFQVKLGKFEQLIAEVTQQDSEASPEERRQYINETLRFDAFCDHIRSLFGPDIRNQDLKAIYRKITTNPDAKVDWSELFGYFQSDNEEQEQIVNEEVSVFTVSKRHRIGEAAGDKKRRDTIQCIVYNPQYEIYLTASQKGVICVWGAKTMRLQSCCDINESSWVTGVDYLPSIRRVAAATERSIAIWDNRSKGKHPSNFVIKPLEHSPQCMTYVPCNNNLHEDCILIGDDEGYVNLVTIAAKDLNTKNARIDKKNPQNLCIDPATLSYPIQSRKLHDDWVLMVKYFPELKCFASCSPSSSVSFVLEDVERISDNLPIRQTIGISKGINCFAYCAKANVIATGGGDKVIRIWHPHIFSKPTGKMIGHLFTIIDIAVNEKDQHVISLSTARVFRIWDIHTLTSLQVFTDNEERPGEKRIHCMVFDDKHERLVTGCSVLDVWPLTRAVQDTMQVPHTHDRPITQALFNRELNQVVSVCSESLIKVWEMEVGRQVYQIAEAHGPNVEVTAIALDKTGYRLASGALDGSVKVWDFGSGQEIRAWSQTHDPEREEDLSVTGLMYCLIKDQRCLIAMGWNNKLKLLQDQQDGDLLFVMEFNDIYYWPQEPTKSSPGSPNVFTRSTPLPEIGQGSAQITSIFKKDDILSTHEICCMDILHSENIFATGCSNGNTALWDIEGATVQRVFKLPGDDSSSNNSSRESGERTREGHRSKPQNTRRVNALKFLVHKIRRPDPAYIKKLTGHVSGTNTPTGSVKADNAADKGDDEQVDQSEDSSKASQRESRLSQMEEDKENKEDVEMKNDDEKGGNDGEEGIKDDNTGDADDDEEEDIDPQATMIVTSYDPLIVTCHADACIRFWTLQGEMVKRVSAMTRKQGSPVTAVCADLDCHVMFTGDHKGYITMWDIGKFLIDPKTEERDAVKQLISWRAHLTRVVTLTYIDHMKGVMSGSTDGSVRMWYAGTHSHGHFMGFFGQHRPWNIPNTERTTTPVLPYDISERPMKPIKSKSARQKAKPVQTYEYPLIFNEDRWQPFRRSAYFQKPPKPKPSLDPEDKKFFGALRKPQFYNDHLEYVKTTDVDGGAVFRSLPVYRISTPQRMNTPAIDFGLSPSQENQAYLFAAPGKLNRASPVKDLGRANQQQQQQSRNRKTSRLTTGASGTTSSSLNSLPSPRKR
ncbi:WD repeat-containing protein 64-like isoform X2 [Ptychodera flava]|uniref:WD repeat-containing protein 64-like isoform X2 n=1 Tax=Ptychodera flava TaxID=63121 RepID=UPI00396A592E